MYFLPKGLYNLMIAGHLLWSGIVVNDLMDFFQHLLKSPVLKPASNIRQKVWFDSGREDGVKRLNEFKSIFQPHHLIDFLLNPRQRFLYKKIIYTGVSLYGLRITRSTSLYGLVWVRIPGSCWPAYTDCSKSYSPYNQVHDQKISQIWRILGITSELKELQKTQTTLWKA